MLQKDKTRSEAIKTLKHNPTIARFQNWGWS